MARAKINKAQKLTYEDAELMRALRKERKPDGSKFTYREIGEKMEVSTVHAREVCIGLYLKEDESNGAGQYSER